MTSEELGEMFEGDSADTKFFSLFLSGLFTFLPEGVVLRFWMLHGTRLKTKMRFVAKQIGG